MTNEELVWIDVRSYKKTNYKNNYRPCGIYWFWGHLRFKDKILFFSNTMAISYANYMGYLLYFILQQPHFTQNKQETFKYLTLTL